MLPTRILLVTAGLALVSGCGTPGTETLPDDTAQRLRYVGQAYGQFTVNYKRPPRNDQELREALAKLKLGDPDTLVRSPRDGQPFVIVWGFDVRQTSAGYEGGNKQNADSAGAIYIYEREGNAGQRYALFTHGGVRQLPSEEFRQARFFGGHQPR